MQQNNCIRGPLQDPGTLRNHPRCLVRIRRTT
jgi:hypothetical protein